MKSFIQRWLPAFLMMAMIFTFSHIPSDEMPTFDKADLFVKKGGHAVGYGLLALACLRGFKGADAESEKPQIILAFLLTALYAISDEFHQSFIRGRQASVWDVVIDACGAAVALWAWMTWSKKQRAVDRLLQ